MAPEHKFMDISLKISDLFSEVTPINNLVVGSRDINRKLKTTPQSL